MASVSLRNVTKSFGTTEVIHGLDLEVAHRELVVFVGPSGCGKSTLLRMIAGLEEITSGDLFIDGKAMKETPPARRGIAMVFQSYALYPHKTVRGNLGFGLRMAKLDKATIRRKVDDAARVLGLETLLDRRPKDLSGGQRQRVAIGRAIVREPQIFLFDEPLSNLDAGLRGQMRVEIARLHQTLDATMIYVTHDQIEAMTLADKIVVLNAGRIEQVGGPMELYERPANLFVAQFIGSPKMNLFAARVEAADAHGCRVRIEGGAAIDLAFGASARLAAGDAVTVGARPEDLRPAAEGFTLPVQAQVVERLGSQTHVIGTFAGRQVTVVLDGRAPVEPGRAFAVGCGTELLHLFDKNGTALRH